MWIKWWSSSADHMVRSCQFNHINAWWRSGDWTWPKMKHYMDCVYVISVSLVSWILWYEIIIFPTWDTCICRCCPTLTVTGSYTDNISIYVSCAEEKIFIKNTSVPHILYMSDDICGPLDEVIKYACKYDQEFDYILLNYLESRKE